MRKLNVIKVIDQFGWSYDFIGREQQKYSKHNIIVVKYNEISFDNIDIVYLHSPNINPEIASLVPLKAKEKKVKVIGGYGGDPNFWSEDVVKKYSYTDLIVTISPETYKFARNICKEPVIFLPESIDTKFFKQSQLNSKNFVVGWAGSSFPIKRPELLKKLKYQVLCQSQWGQQHFLKDRSLSPMLNFYHNLNVFVLTSVTECMPRVILEAMSCGIPIISTNVGNIPLLLDPEWIVPVYPDNTVVEEINLRLDRLAKDFDLQKKVGERNRKYIEENFSWIATQDIWDKTFSDLFENKIDTILSDNDQYLEQFKKYFKIPQINKNKENILFLLPGTGISGGIAVMLKQAKLLQDKGYNVFLYSLDSNTKISWYPNEVPFIFDVKSDIIKNLDIVIFSGWQTVINFPEEFQTVKRKIYFVQSDERRFFDDVSLKKIVHSTYENKFEYMTEALWIQKWLKSEFNHDSYYVPNGIDTSIFYKTQFNEKRKIRVLLEGAIDLQFKGVRKAYYAVKDLDCEIWFVSNSGKPEYSWRYDKFFEKVSFCEMKELYSSCDILLKMSSIEGFFGPPMEAMACGCAVVVGKCTGYDEYIKHEENALVVDVNNIESAKQAVKRLIENKQLRETLIKNGYETIKQWTWEKTLESLENVIKQKIEKEEVQKQTKIEVAKVVSNATIPIKIEVNQNPIDSNIKCDIIIVTYNACEYIKRCIESIKKYTLFPYNLIIVDNNSNYETKSYLLSLDNIKIIFNEKNYGFGYANNQGILESTSKYICFLNSDTIVTESWLNKLIDVLESSNAGLIGPVTNFVSLDCQKANPNFVHNVNSNDDTNIQNFSRTRNKEFKNTILETNKLIGFCFITKKETLEKVGYFDERFPIGCFEDDDLCLRFIERGYKLYCALGIFIYHFGGESFKDNFKVKTNLEVLKKNETIYVDKWYKTNRIEKIYSEKKPLKISYFLASDSPSGGVKVVFEHANRLKARGHEVKIYCLTNENSKWFKVNVPIIYGNVDYSHCDIAIGTYFTTLSTLRNIKADIKIHFCQGYEAFLYEQQNIISSIKNNYNLLKTKIVVSKWLQEIIKKEFNIDSYFISNGIDQYVFSFKQHDNNDIPRILIVGTNELKFKGTEVALEAVKQFSKERKLQIVRLSSSKQSFEDSKLEYHNMSEMTQEQIAKVYESCDLTICASFKVEGFSLPPLESMASGTPVITSDNGGVNTYATDNYNALIVRSQDPQAIYHSIKLLLNNKSLYNKLIDNGLQTAKDYYWYKQLDKLEALYYDLYDENKKNKGESLSVCLIVKNEEKYLEDCLKSIRNLASEIIIIDTGSVDNTIQIAKKFGASIYHFAWNDNFSDARNFALSKATQSWVFILDADETISEKDHDKFRQLLKDKKISYNFITRNYVNDYKTQDLISLKDGYNEGKNYAGWCKSTKIRLFPNVNTIKFEGQVHELVEQSIKNNNIKILDSSIPVHHYGFLDKQKQKFKEKEYLNLGIKKAKNQDLKSLTELALQYMSLNNFDEALVTWRKALQLESKNYEVLAKIGTTYNLLKDYVQAEKYFLESLKVQETEYTYQHLGICYAKQENYEKCYEVLKKIAYSTNDLQTKANFAHCCNILKKFDESIVILEKCLVFDQKRTCSWDLLDFAYNEKGIELAKNGRLDLSLTMFKNALKVNPNFKNASLNILEINKILKL